MGCHAANYDTFEYYPNIKLDGGWGKYTKTQLQYFLCFVDVYERALDGDFGYYSVVALQTWLRKRGFYPASKWLIDGDLGNATWDALEAYLNYCGFNTTGWSTVRNLQDWLNYLNGTLPFPRVTPLSQYKI